MKIAIKHRTNNCKDYMGSSCEIIMSNLVADTRIISLLIGWLF